MESLVLLGQKKKKRDMSFLWEAVCLWFPNPVSEREEFH